MMLEQLRERYAALVRERDEHHTAAMGESPAMPPEGTPEREEADRLNNEIRWLADELASYPAMFDAMRGYMVDVKGSGSCSPATKEDFEEGLEDFRAALDKRGPLPQQVQRFLESQGWRITDRGFGGCDWHLGVPCTESESRTLCTALHARFERQIAAGLLRVQRHHWGWRLRDDPRS